MASQRVLLQYDRVAVRVVFELRASSGEEQEDSKQEEIPYCIYNVGNLVNYLE